jgi:hypothetical protein
VREAGIGFDLATDIKKEIVFKKLKIDQKTR